jgi:hypothetical protein
MAPTRLRHGGKQGIAAAALIPDQVEQIRTLARRELPPQPARPSEVRGIQTQMSMGTRSCDPRPASISHFLRRSGGIGFLPAHARISRNGPTTIETGDCVARPEGFEPPTI